MYAMLMRKHLLSNDVVIYNPIKVIKGEFDEEDNYFLDEMGCDFPEATDIAFIVSCERQECYAYPITEEDLLNRYLADLKEITGVALYKTDGTLIMKKMQKDITNSIKKM